MKDIFSLSKLELETICSVYDIIDSIKSYRLLNAGCANANYKVYIGNIQCFVKVLCHHTLEEVQRETSLLDYLNNHGFITPSPFITKEGTLFTKRFGKYIFILPFIHGKIIEQYANESIALSYVSQIAKELAKLHVLAKEWDVPREGRFSMSTIFKLADSFTFLANNLIEEQDRYLLKTVPSLIKKEKDEYFNLPMGLIHSDLFRDNVLSNEKTGEIVAILDFEAMRKDVFIYDIATGLNDWCYVNGHYDTNLCRTFIKEYETIRPLTKIEQQAFGIEWLFSAFRFYVSRIEEYHLPKLRGDKLLTFKSYIDYRKRVEFLLDNMDNIPIILFS